MVLQKDIEIKRSYRPEHNGVYDYCLIISGDPIETKHSSIAYDSGLVYVNPSDYSVHLEMYRNDESIPETDFNDQNTFIVPVLINQ